MSYLVVDSGGTKSDWAFCNNKEVVYKTEIKSFGIELKDPTMLPSKVLLHLQEVENIYYYGSGITSVSLKENVRNILKKACNKACSINVFSDLLGAARSTAAHDSGYVVILGTGSNFCFFDGNNIIQKKPSLGYIIGDEGAGTSIGKAIIKSYLYNEMPNKEKVIFENKFSLNKDKLLENIAIATKAPRYIAQYACIGAEANSEYYDSLIYSELEKLFKRKVLSSYENIAAPVHFIGSIAYFYSYLIKKLCSTYDLEVGQIIQKPITGLINYHNE